MTTRTRRTFHSRTEQWVVVEPGAGLDIAQLAECLPGHLQGHQGVPSFVRSVSEWAGLVGSLVKDWPAVTGKDMREGLRRVEDLAYEMQTAMQPLAQGSEMFKTLNVDFKYLHLRAHEVGGMTEGRPVVPALPADVPLLPELLTRLHEDLESLRVACSHLAGKIRPDQNPTKCLERMLVEGVARSYLEHFGERPPKRGNFADALIPHIAGAIGMDIGHRVVGEVVSKMT